MLSVVAKMTDTDGKSATAPISFEDFWLLYPKRQAKKDATRAWAKMSEADRLAALVAVVDWRAVWRSRGDDRYTPLPASWLNAERWTDEVTAEFTRPTHASHVLAKPKEQSERGPIPAHVLAALERLRKG